MGRYLKLVTIVALLGVTLILPLMAQQWVEGYCLRCVRFTTCGTGCTEGSTFLGVERMCRTCGPVQGFTYACTACNWHKYNCIPVQYGVTCPPYWLTLVRFSNVGSNLRPLVCRVSGDYIYCAEL